MSVSDKSYSKTKSKKCTDVKNEAQRASFRVLSKSIKSNVETRYASQCASRRI